MTLIDTFTYLMYQLLYVDWFWDEKNDPKPMSRLPKIGKRSQTPEVPKPEGDSATLYK